MAATKHHEQKANQKKKGLLILHFHFDVYHQKVSGQELKQEDNLEAGINAQAMEGADS